MGFEGNAFSGSCNSSCCYGLVALFTNVFSAAQGYVIELKVVSSV